jgi:hypothetical protein
VSGSRPTSAPGGTTTTSSSRPGADGGDIAAEEELIERYRTDTRLHPGETIESFSPYGGVTEVVLKL